MRRLLLVLFLLLSPALARDFVLLGESKVCYCNPDVIRQINHAWRESENGNGNLGTLEVGFRVDYIDGKIVVGPLIYGEKGYSVDIPINTTTIAIVHTHPNGGKAVPSKEDRASPVPNYILSRVGEYVTDPATRTYHQIFLSMGSCR